MTRSEDCNLKRVDAPQLGIALEEIFQFQFVVREKLPGKEDKSMCCKQDWSISHAFYIFLNLKVETEMCIWFNGCSLHLKPYSGILMFRLFVGDKQQNVKFMNHNSMNGRQWRCPPCPDLTAFHMRSTIYGTHNLSREGRGGEGRCRRDLAPCHVSLEKAVAVVDGLHHARQTKIPQALGARDFAHVCKCRSPPCPAHASS